MDTKHLRGLMFCWQHSDQVARHIWASTIWSELGTLLALATYADSAVGRLLAQLRALHPEVKTGGVAS